MLQDVYFDVRKAKVNQVQEEMENDNQVLMMNDDRNYILLNQNTIQLNVIDPLVNN